MDYKKVLDENSQDIEKMREELLDTKKIRAAFNEHDRFSISILIAYVLYKTQDNNQKKIPPIDVFISSELPDENTKLFFQKHLENVWDSLDKLLYCFTTKQLFTMIVVPISESSRFEKNETPSSVNKVAIGLLGINENERVVDFGSGVGQFLIESYVEQPNAYYYGIDKDTYAIAVSLIRTWLLNSNINIHQGDMFDFAKEHRPFDKIFSNFPFGMRLRNIHDGVQHIKELSEDFPDLTKATSSDWIFCSLLVSSLSANGKAVCVISNGSTWNSIDKPIREYFVRSGLIECVISLPEKIFSHTGIATTILVLSRNNSNIRFVDASNEATAGRRINKFNKENIGRILKATKHVTDISCIRTLSEVAEKNYLLNPVRYLHEPVTFENAVKLEDVAIRITRGASCNARYLDEIASVSPTDKQYLMLANIKDGLIDEELPYINKIESRYNKYCIKKGDVLLSKIGTPFKVAVVDVPEGKRILANGNLYIIELDEEKIIPYYLKAFFQSELGNHSLESIVVGATIPNIAIEQLKKLLIPVPPMEKQIEIANRYLECESEVKFLKYKLGKALDALKSVITEGDNGTDD